MKIKNILHRTTTRKLGTHINCGGTVIYISSPTYGYRFCEKCKDGGMLGWLSFKQPKTVEELKNRELIAIQSSLTRVK